MAKPNVRTITFQSIDEARSLWGEADQHLRILEELFPVRIVARGLSISLKGAKADVEKVESLIEKLRNMVAQGEVIDRASISGALRLPGTKGGEAFQEEGIPVPSKRRFVKPRTPGQKRYVEAIRLHDIVFGIGPAGTGKTYMAVAMAVSALRSGEVSRIVLVRPAVEAGEKLGFLPGTFQEKIDPYLRPLYDALYDTLEPEKFRDLLARGVIEVAPLAFMRGRTLNDAFIILDEAQNTTVEQMKMFLTRLGFDSKAVVTGDVTQTDLPADRRSGLVQVLGILQDIKGIAFVTFDEQDVVRHELVQQIIRAYAAEEKKRK